MFVYVIFPIGAFYYFIQVCGGETLYMECCKFKSTCIIILIYIHFLSYCAEVLYYHVKAVKTITINNKISDLFAHGGNSDRSAVNSSLQ